MTATLVVAVTCVAILTLAWAFQRSLIYFPFGAVPSPAEVGLADVEAVTFDTQDGIRLHGWFMKSRPSPGFTLAVFNGNAGNRGMRASLAAEFAQHGMSTLLFDYRGYGDNAGRPSEDGLARDARAARSYLTTRADVDTTRLVYFGESLGAAVALRLATENPPVALVLRSPFTSLADAGQHQYPFLPVRWFLRDRYPSFERTGSLSCPTLVIAGDRDSIVPTEQSRRLFAAIRTEKRLVIITGADHNDETLFHGPELIQAVVEFVAKR